VAVLVTALVFWIAHAYADLLARGLVGTRGTVVAHAKAELAREWPLVLGALPPVLPLLLGPLGVLSDDSAETAGIATGIAVLAVWGMAIARRRGSGLIGIAYSAGVSALFGLVVVGLKALVH
jgi:hypothetical protein